MADPTDDHIRDLLEETEGDTWAVAETICDAEVARGEYEGCSTELELAFAEYERRAKQLAIKIEGWWTCLRCFRR